MYATDAPSPPTDLSAMFTGINVSWTPPPGGTLATEYSIYYEATSGGADMGSAAVGGASTSVIPGRTSGAYTVRIVALSTQLPSTAATATTTGGESMSIVITAYSYIHPHSLIRSFAVKPPPPFLREKYQYRVNLSPLHPPPPRHAARHPPPTHAAGHCKSAPTTSDVRKPHRYMQARLSLLPASMRSPFWLAPILIGYHCLLLFTCFRV